MHMEDLQILVIGEIGSDTVQGLLWDPMPGGSGLLERLRERFAEVVDVAREVVEGCRALVSHPASIASRPSATRTTTTSLTERPPSTR